MYLKRLLLSTAAALLLANAATAPAQAHNAPTTCSVSTDKTTKYKTIFVGHIRDGETVWLQQDNKSKQIWRGHTYTSSKSAASVHISNDWTKICSG